MTADNRTNVQIVADALRSMPEAERDDDRDPAVVVAEYAVAALVAAQGAAPQAESVSKSSYISPSLPAQIRGLYRADLRERSIQTMLDLAGDLIQELIDLKAAQGAEPQTAKDIHEPNHDRVYCVRCGGNWPCPTIAALEGGESDE